MVARAARDYLLGWHQHIGGAHAGQQPAIQTLRRQRADAFRVQTDAGKRNRCKIDAGQIIAHTQQRHVFGYAQPLPPTGLRQFQSDAIRERKYPDRPRQRPNPRVQGRSHPVRIRRVLIPPRDEQRRDLTVNSRRPRRPLKTRQPQTRGRMPGIPAIGEIPIAAPMEMLERDPANPPIVRIHLRYVAWIHLPRDIDDRHAQLAKDAHVAHRADLRDDPVYPPAPQGIHLVPVSLPKPQHRHLRTIPEIVGNASENTPAVLDLDRQKCRDSEAARHTRTTVSHAQIGDNYA